MAAPYICLYINIHCASHRTITSLGNQPNMKVVVNIPWKLVFLSLSLGMERHILQNFWGAKTLSLKLSNWALPDPLPSLIKGFFSCPPSRLLLHLHEESYRGWREKYFCQNQLILSLKISLAQGCVLGTWRNDAVPRGFQSIFLYFPRWRKWVAQTKEQHVFVVKVLKLG